MTIDIHAHVISTDTHRYPNAPLGGHKSDWSRERPVSAERMIAAMSEAGIRYGRRRQQNFNWLSDGTIPGGSSVPSALACGKLAAYALPEPEISIAYRNSWSDEARLS